MWLSDLDAVKLVLGLLFAVVTVVMVRSVHAAFKADLITHSHTPTEGGVPAPREGAAPSVKHLLYTFHFFDENDFICGFILVEYLAKTVER